MSESIPERGSPGGGKRLFGMPRNYVVIGGVAFAGTILYLWWKNRKGGTSAGAVSQQGAAGTDYSGQLSALQSEIQQLQQQGAGSSGGGGLGGGGGGGWTYGDWTGGSGGGSSSGGGDSGSGTPTGSGNTGSSDSGWGTTTTSSGSSSGGDSSSSNDSGGNSSSGNTSSGNGPPSSSPPSVYGRANGSQIVLTCGTVNGATGYEWQIARPGGSLWHDSKTGEPAAYYSPAPTTGTYYFKVRATNNSGAGPWSAVKQVTVTR